MSFEDRERKIIQLVKEKNYISVKELTKLLYVSEPTIRRDLTLLEKKGLLKRNRGGASYVSRQQTQYPRHSGTMKIYRRKNISRGLRHSLSKMVTLFLWMPAVPVFIWLNISTGIKS